MKSQKKITRREFFKFSGLAVIGAALSAHTPKVASQSFPEDDHPIYLPVVIRNNPPIVTPQGKQLPFDAAPLAQQVCKVTGREPVNFDSTLDTYTGRWTHLLAEPLVQTDATQTFVPALAESWSVGPYAAYWEYTIRQGATWSDGVPITADDIVYTFVHLADPQMHNNGVFYFFDIKGVLAYSSGQAGPEAISDPVTGGVRKVNDRTVRFYADTLPIPQLPALLAWPNAGIIPKHVVEPDPLHWADLGVGVVSGGAYQVKQWVHNASIEYELNLAYNGPHKPGIQHYYEMILPNGVDPFNVWLNHDLTLLDSLPWANVDAARANPDLLPLLRTYNDFQTDYLSLDTVHAPLNNLALRQALSHAIDRETLCDTLLNQVYIPAFSMLMPGFPAYNSGLASVQSYNVTLAQTLLTSAGYPGGIDPGTSLPLQLTLYSAPGDGTYNFYNPAKLAFVKQQWETNLGIEVEIVDITWDAWIFKRSQHQMQIYKGPYQFDYIDPAHLLSGLWHSKTPPQGQSEPWGSDRHPWKSVVFDTLCDQAALQTDHATRMQTLKDAEQILVSDVGGIFMTHQLLFQIWWPNLVGIQPDAAGNVIFRTRDLSLFQMYIHE